MRAVSGAVAVFSLVLVSSAHAATVTAVEDEVFVGGYGGYQRVSGTTRAKIGDSVMAGEYGVGRITYPNGCVITVRPGTVVKIDANPPCETPADWSANLEPTATGLSTHHILLGAGIAAGIGGGIWALTQSGDDDKPSSP